MRTLALAALMLVASLLALAQGSADVEDKAPPDVDQALRARVELYYRAFMAGRFKDAYVLVADDSQDAFLESDKQQYKACETIKIRYSDKFTKATVVESCKGEWRWHGVITPTTFPITSSWKIEDGKWVWSYVRPTQVPSPFSPTGFIPVPPSEATAKDAAGVPKDMRAAAQNILAKVSVDKKTVNLRPDQSSKDAIHVHNGMPGVIKLQMDPLLVPGLKIVIEKSELAANEDAVVSFEYRQDDPAPCPDCAKKIKAKSYATLHVLPTAQTFYIGVEFGPPSVPMHIHQQTLAPSQQPGVAPQPANLPAQKPAVAPQQ